MADKGTFYLNQPEPQRSCLVAMRDMLLAKNPYITETVKYGMPCFCYQGKVFCYLWLDKKSKEPYFLMVEGKHLTHPNLEAGKRARMKILRVDPKANLPIKTIHEILDQALNLYTHGTIPE